MARKHNTKGNSAPLTTGIKLRPRTSRHGKPMSEVFKVKQVTKRTVETNAETGALEVKHVVVQQARGMSPDELERARASVKRASSSTQKHGKANAGGK